MEIGEAVRRLGLADTYRDRHWNRAVKVTDNTVQKAGPEWLEGLLAALLRIEKPASPMGYAFEVALRRLASAPGGAGRIASVRTLAAEGRTWRGDLRYTLPEIAALLACDQPPEHLLAVFDGAEASDELAACLLQETALRYDATSAAGFADRLRASGHPLADLPLHPVGAERHLGLARYPTGLAGQRWPSLGDGAPDAPGPSGLELQAAAVDWPGARQALSAYRHWPPGDDVQEAALFRLGSPLAPGDFGASVLRALPAASTAASTAAGVAGVRRVTTADVLRTLFGGAAGGGACGPRMGGGYARKASWESLAALAGVQEGDFTAIERAADRCAWLFYGSDWHLQVVPPLDVGIAVLRPDRRTVAVVAVTDSD
ncbi:DUF6183 family protein [Actinomadura sp. WMMA1423]|uniref:DUF6183 family protein n=1 Tax=Actinomadura sp. WMMA1423 TaxID=2591108 RepID=UPI0011472D8A|nr:DUF6183 family protein [Actinomadura sp. WMMA1423]